MLINTNYLDELTHLAWSNVISVKNVFYFSETSKMVRLFEKRERNAEAPFTKCIHGSTRRCNAITERFELLPHKFRIKFVCSQS